MDYFKKMINLCKQMNYAKYKSEQYEDCLLYTSSVTDLVKQTWESFLDSDLHLVSYRSGAKGARTDKTSGGWVLSLIHI